MNISDVSKNKFRLAIGGIIVLMMVLYFFFVYPYRTKSFKNIKGIEDALARLEIYKRKGLKIINEEWIEAEKVKLKTLEEEQLKYIELFKERNRHIEKIFSTANEGEIKDKALWKDHYIKRVNFVLGKLARSNIKVHSDALPFKEWGDEIPAWDIIGVEQKRFWIIEELLNILQKKQLKIRNLESISFAQGDFLPDNTQTEGYDIIPCTIKLDMHTENVLFLIDELTKSKIIFEVDYVNMSGRLNRLRLSGLPEEPKDFQSNTLVNVIIRVHIIDFKT